jgi:hypothetical protein
MVALWLLVDCNHSLTIRHWRAREAAAEGRKSRKNRKACFDFAVTACSS